MKHLYAFLVLLLIGHFSFGQITENFDTGLVASGYHTGNQSLTSGTWTSVAVFNEGATNARGATGSAARINDDVANASLTTPALSGAGVVSFWYRALNPGDSGTFALQTSTDGTNYTTQTTQSYTSDTYTQFTYTLNDSNTNLTIRILNNNQPAHLIIDDFEVTSYSNNSSINITTSGGNYPSEKWVSITTAVDGGGTQVWGQGNGTQCNGSGYLTNEVISLPPGTYYVNCYDQYDDSWDGTLISVTAYGSVIGDNGGISPNDGLDTDLTTSCEGTPEELEASFQIIVPNPPLCFVPTALAVDDFTYDGATISWTAINGETDWEIVVQADGLGTPAASGTGTTTNPHTLSGLTELTAYEVYVRANCGVDGFSSWVGPVDFTTAPSCPDITGLTLDSATDTTGTISWTAGGTETAWEIVVQPDATGIPTGAGSATTTNPHTETGLTASTDYEVYVRADCTGASNGYSGWVGPIDFTTTSTPITTFPYNENFEGGAAGWTIDNSTNGSWQLGNPVNTIINVADSGANAWVTNLTGDYNTNETSYVISPPLNFSTLAAPVIELSVWYSSESGYDGMLLQSSIDNGSTWQNVGVNGDPDNWYNSSAGWSGDSGAWLVAKHDLTGLGGQSSVFLRAAFDSDGSTNGEGVAFDTVNIFQPACPDVTGITIDSFTDTDAVISWTAGNTETDWEIVVQADGTGVPTGAGTATTTNPYAASGLTAETAYEVYVRADCGANGISAWVGPIDFTTQAACPDISGVTIDSTTDTTATISWTVNGVETDWEIVVQADGTGAPAGAGTATTTNPHTESSLTGNTAYEVYVRADCTSASDGYSNWVGPVTFTTACGALVPEYVADMSTNVPDACWEEAGSGEVAASPGGIGSSDWRQGTSYAIGSSNAINLYQAVDREWLLSPTFDLSTGGPFQLEVNVAVTNYASSTVGDTMGSDDEVQLLSSTDGGTTWVNITTWNVANQPALAGTEFTADLTAITGNVQFAIWASDGTVDDAEDYDFHVGKFRVRAIPTCLEVTDLTIDSFIDSETVVSWTAGNTETDWEIVVQADGTGVPTGSGTATTTNPHTETGLTAETAYEVYVRANCLTNGFSAWVGPVTFTTACATFTAPYTEGFENAGTVPDCWTLAGTNNWLFNTSGPNHVGNAGTITGSTTSGNYYAVVDDSNSTATTAELISPYVDLTPLTAPALSFYEISNNEANPSATLTVEVWDGAAWNLVGTYNTNTSGWEEKIIDLSGLTFTGPAQVKYIVTDSGSFYDDIAIDDVSFNELPSCLDPTALTLDTATDVTADISWTAGDTETAWEIVVQADGTGVPTGTGTAITTNPYTESGLTALTAYEVYVRADCGANGFSGWVGPLDFTTTATKITSFPYTEDFESGPGDWSADNTNSGTWELGAPINTIINSADSGANAWVTDLDGTYNANEDSYVISPPFDFSTLVAPEIELSVWWNAEFSWDGMALQSSIDNGSTWQLVGTNGDPDNWYNDSSIGGAPGGQQLGWTGRNSSSNGSAGWLVAKHALTGLGGESTVILRVAFAADGSGQDEGVGFDTVTISQPACPDLTALAVDSFTNTAATISWMAGNTETNWEIVIQADGTGVPTGTGTATTTNPHTDSSLTENTAYEVYVRANCLVDGFSEWVGPVDFTTLCSDIVPEYIADMSTNVPDACWDESNDGEIATGPSGSDTSDWTTGSYSFGASNRINLFSNVDREWLLSPTFDLSTGGPYQLEMNVAVTDFAGTADDTMGSDDEVQLLSSTDGGTTWVNITTWNAGNEPLFTGTEYIADLTAYTSTVQFAVWASDGTVDDTEDYNFHIGQFIVRTPPTCLDVSGITIDSFTPSDVTISWTNGDTETAWEVAVQADGTGVPTAAGSAATTNPHTEGGLTGETAYEVYVRADCAANGFSAWIGPVDFTTPCDYIIPDYIEDFTTIIPTCWDEATNGDATTGPTGLGSGDWAPDGYLNSGTTGAYKINLYASSKSDWILTPVFDLTGGPFQVEYDFGIMEWNSSSNAGTLGSDDLVQLLVTADGGTTWTALVTYDSNTSIPVTGMTEVVDLTAYNGQIVQFGIYATEGTTDDSADNDIFVDNFKVRTPPTCLDITGLTVDTTTATDVTVSWTAGDTETAWEIVVQADGTGIPGAAGTATTTNPHTETGLTEQTAYEVYVRADCVADGFSGWVGPVDFTTGCLAITDFNENFDTVTTPDLPSCWSSIIDNGASSFASVTSSTSADNSLPNGISLYNSSSAATSNIMLVSPNLSNLSDGTHRLRFYARNTTATQDIEVGTVTDPTDGSTFTALSSIDIDGTFTEYEVSFAAYAGTDTYIAIRRLSTSTYTNVYLDDIVWEAIPSCFEPSDITLDSVTRDSATLSWTPGTTETDWEVVIQAEGTGIPSGAGTATSANPYTETGLTAATNYEAYIRSDCGVTDGLSVWEGPFTFTTSNPLPTTTVTLDITACGIGNEDSYNGAFDASTSNIVWAQLNYTGSCPSLTVDTITSDFDTEIGIYDTDGNLIGTNDEGGTGIDPQSLFTELGLANGTYYIAAGASSTTFGPDFVVTSTNTTQTGTLYINVSTQSNDTVDFCNIQSPNSGIITEGGTFDVYSRIYQAGITDGGTQGANIQSWIGYSTTDATTTADFATGWTWVPATYNTSYGNDDEYQATFGSTLTPGVYYYASRFSYNNGAYAYGGINPGSTGGNFWNGTTAVSGQLTVNSASIPTTVATFNIAGCGDSDSYNGAYASVTDDVVWVELIYDGNCTEITVDTESSTGIDTQIGLYDVFGNFISMNDDGGTGTLSLLTEASLPAGTYYIVAGAYSMTFGSNFGVSSSDTIDSGTLYINASTPNFVDFCNLQSPSSGSIVVGSNFDVYAQIYEPGVTEPAGQGANIEAWIGYNTTDATTSADFTSGWTWLPATYNTDGVDGNANNDEYQADIGSGLAVGTYYYVSRFSVDSGDFAYGGINPGSTNGNFWDGTNFVSGVLTVNPIPEPTNHALAFTAVADSDSQITLTWNDNDGAQPADGFVIVGKTGTGVFTTIVDGTDPANDIDWSDDEFEFKRASGLQSYTVVNLNASTLYEFEIYPYTNAGTLIDFKTDGTIPSASATTGADPCLVAINTFPYDEGFESGILPACWSQEVEAGSANWTYNNGSQGGTITSAHTGAFNAMFYDTSRTGVVKLVSPKLDISGISAPTLSFWHAQEAWGSDQDELRVYYKTSEAGAWTLIPGQTFTSSITTWTEETIELPNPSAEYYIAFEGTGDYGRGVIVDDVKVEEVIAVTYTYTGTWAPSDPNGTATTNDDIIIMSGDAVISATTSADNVTVNPGASLTINAGVTLTVDGDVTLESVSNSYSSLMYDGTIVGTIKYERYVNANSGGNDLISAPLAGETWSSFLASDTNAADLLDNGQTSPTTYAFAPFDKGVDAYVNFTDATSATLTSGIGFRAATDSGTTLTFTGTVPTSTVPVNIVDTGANHPDWNLIGNPYPSYISSFNFLFYDSGAGVFNFQLFEDGSGIYGYDGDAANGWNVITLASPDTPIAPGQGFLVAADDAYVLSNNVVFDPSMRTTVGGDDFIAGRNADVLTYFKLSTNTSVNDYTTQFYFNDNATQELDHGYDGKLLDNFAPDFALYSQLVEGNPDMRLALQALHPSDMMDVVIPLGVNANSGEQLTFTISESTLPSTVEVYLDDTLNNTSTLLTSSDYVITPNTNISSTGRFYLRVTDNTLSLNDEDFNSIKIYTKKSPRSIFIQGIINEGTTATIHDIQGRLVYSTDLESNNLVNEIDASDFQDGVYVVTLIDGSQQKSQKVIIR
jgi:MAM domain, meprin/A5/mu/Secretion system C-terminal sorting domain